MTPAGWPVPVVLSNHDGAFPAIWREPASDHAGEAYAVLFVPPFAEEMNRTRRLMALAGRKLAEAGVCSLLPDLPGTGDSPLPFSEARWDKWHAALAACADYISGKGLAVRLAGFRLGGLLAADAMTSGLDAEALYLIDPVEDGRLHMRHWLRIRSAASLEIGPRITLSYLQTQLDSGTSVEVAGYEMHPELVTAVSGIRLAPLLDKLPAPVHRIDVVAPGTETDTQTEGRRVIAAEAPWASYEPAEPLYLADAVSGMILERP